MRDYDMPLVVCGAGIGVAIVALFVVAYVGHQPEHETVVAPDGKPAILVTCHSPGDCVREQAKACPTGYSVLSSSSERDKSTTYVYTGKSSGVAVPVESESYTGSTLIRCGQ